jgi:hypothetical protein
MEISDHEYRYEAFLKSLETVISTEEVKNIDPKLTHALLANWALNEVLVDLKQKLPYFPANEDSVRKMFTLITEAIPTINGGSKNYIEKMYALFKQYTEKYNPLIPLNYLHHHIQATNT